MLRPNMYGAQELGLFWTPPEGCCRCTLSVTNVSACRMPWESKGWDAFCHSLLGYQPPGVTRGFPRITGHFHTREISFLRENECFWGWTLRHCTILRSLSIPGSIPISPGISHPVSATLSPSSPAREGAGNPILYRLQWGILSGHFFPTGTWKQGQWDHLTYCRQQYLRAGSSLFLALDPIVLIWIQLIWL